MNGSELTALGWGEGRSYARQLDPNPPPGPEGTGKRCDAFYSDFASEVLQSSNLAVVAAVLPFCSDLL